MKGTEPIELAELIDTVASELLKAEAHAASRSKRILALDDVELELTLTFEKRAGMGIKAYVLSIGGGVKGGQTHRIKTSFKPHGEPASFLTGEGEPETTVGYEGPTSGGESAEVKDEE
jgi:hypothetical protein